MYKYSSNGKAVFLILLLGAAFFTSTDLRERAVSLAQNSVLQNAAEPEAAGDGMIPFYARCKARASGVKIRTAPFADAPEQGYSRRDSYFNIVGQYSSGWYKLTYGSDYGFISAEDVIQIQEISNPGTDSGKIPYHSSATATDEIIVYSAASIRADSVGKIYPDENVVFTHKLPNGWLIIQFGGRNGYIRDENLTNIQILPLIPPESFESVTILLDPGHGAGDSGAENKDLRLLEKDLNLKVALYTKEELERYEGVRVFLTRDRDLLMNAEDRFLEGYALMADLVVCQHFNGGLNEGASVFVSIQEDYAPREAAQALLEEIEKLGVRNQGVKTWADSYLKNKDHFRALRWAAACGQKALLIEHCYMTPGSPDTQFIDSEADLKAFGIADATAIAKTFNLCRKSLPIKQE